MYSAPILLVAVLQGGPAAYLARLLNRTYLQEPRVRIESVIVPKWSLARSTNLLPLELLQTRWSAILLLCDEAGEVNEMTLVLKAQEETLRNVELRATLSNTFAPAWTDRVALGSCNRAYFEVLLAEQSIPVHECGEWRMPCAMVHIPHKKHKYRHVTMIMGLLQQFMRQDSVQSACTSSTSPHHFLPWLPRLVLDHTLQRVRRDLRPPLPSTVLVAAFPGGIAAHAVGRMNATQIDTLRVDAHIFPTSLRSGWIDVRVFTRQWAGVLLLCDDYPQMGLTVETLAHKEDAHTGLSLLGLQTTLHASVRRDRLSSSRYSDGKTPAPSRCNEAFYSALVAAKLTHNEAPVMLLHAGKASGPLRPVHPQDITIFNAARWLLEYNIEFGSVYENTESAKESQDSDVSEHIGSVPAFDRVCVQTPDIEFLTVVTEPVLEYPLRSAHVGGLPCFTNLGKGRRWRGYMSRLELVYHYLELAYNRGDDPNKIFVYLDGSDMIWGGCSKYDFLARYYAIVNKSGRKIIFGACLYCQDQNNCNAVPSVPKWAGSLTGVSDIGAGFWSGRTKCFGVGDIWCDKTPVMKHLNAGFYAGPLSVLKAALFAALSSFQYLWYPQCTDQCVLNELLAQTRSSTLDYTSSLVLTMDGVKDDQLQVQGADLVGPIIRLPLCFVHFAGGSKKLLSNVIVPKLRNVTLSVEEQMARWMSSLDRSSSTGVEHAGGI